MNEKRIKTEMIRRIEYEWGVGIEELIREGSVRDVGRRLGVSGAVVSLWRKRLGIERRYEWEEKMREGYSGIA